MVYLEGGSSDFTSAAIKSIDLTKARLSWRNPDHCPLWGEFSVLD
jgi:hypothetical protein